MSVDSLVDREDRPALVRFETVAVEDKRASLEAGRSMSKDVDYAYITPPYSKDEVVIKVDTWFENTERNVRNKRTPQSWLDHWRKQYEAFKAGKEAPLNGTPIRDWSSITPAQRKNLISMNILTVEDLAACNDEGMKRIGMGAVELRRKAGNYLQAAKDHGPLTMKVTQLETDNERLQLTVDDLVEKNQALMRKLEALQQPIHVSRETPEVSQGITMDDIAPEIEPIQLKPVLPNGKTEEEVKAYVEARDKPLEKDIRVRYEQKFGKKPHWKMKDETILKKLAE